MNLIDVYSLLQSKQLTPSGAAQALNLTERDLKFRLTRWGHRLPLLLATLDKLKAGAIDTQEAAEALQVTPREVNALMTSWRVRRPIKQYLVQRTATQVKWEVHKKFAIDFIAGATTIDEAAEGADLSPRQMRRVVSQLLDKHFQMVFKDLKDISLKRRRRLADEIETAEGLEYAKQQVLNDIANGRKTHTEEALERLMTKKMRRRSV